MKSKVKNKKITIDDLALMVKNGFDETKDVLGKRIDQLEEKFDRKFIAVDNRLDGIDNRLDGIDNRLDTMGKDIEIIKTDIEFIKEGLKKKVDYEEFAALERRLILLESKIK